MKRVTGTREWAAKTVNVVKGCSHGCRYCYARANALRFGQIASTEEWTTETVNDTAVAKNRGRSRGSIMFPSSHDITPGTLDASLTVLQKLAAMDNTIVVVSKPHRDCIRQIREALDPWRFRILLRFTIGADDDTVLKFWEPGAPDYRERRTALRESFVEGWATSISIEPMLDPRHIQRLVDALAPYVTETIWFGMMNQPRSRFQGVTDADREQLARLEQAQRPEAILAIYDTLQHHPKVRWKDSIRELVRRERGDPEMAVVFGG